MLVAVDGWSLIERPWSVEALHLLEWLGELSAADLNLEFNLLHPPGRLPTLPVEIKATATPARLTPWGRLAYEQWALPRRARSVAADWLFLPGAAAPLTSPVPVVAQLSGLPPTRHRSAVRRLRDSIGQAGAAGAARRLWYSDLPAPASGAAPITTVPPFVGDRFRPLADFQATLARLGLQAGYVLTCLTSRDQIPPLLSAWTWVEGSMGDVAPLVLIGLDPAEQVSVRSQAAALGIDSLPRLIPVADTTELSALFLGAQAYLNVGPEPFGQPLRWALGCGLPIAGIDRPDSAGIVGEAGYLVTAGEARTLGAACLTLLVELELAAGLRQKALLRATAYRGPGPLRAWARIFGGVLQ